ncbi:MAG: esterase-like activity of phytase family protein, partial [Bacteroidota bacterium]
MIRTFFTVFLLICTYPALAQSGERQLKCLHQLEIQAVGPRIIGPSGLCLKGDSLFAVGDRSRGKIFYLDVDPAGGKVSSHAIKLKKKSISKEYEGLGVDANGIFYIACERGNQIVKVDPKDKVIQPFSGALADKVKKSGMLQKENAGLEGVAIRPNGSGYAVAERSGRGLIQFLNGGAIFGTFNLDTLSVPGTAKRPGQ